jgi:hypothetical protein
LVLFLGSKPLSFSRMSVFVVTRTTLSTQTVRIRINRRNSHSNAAFAPVRVSLTRFLDVLFARLLQRSADDSRLGECVAAYVAWSIGAAYDQGFKTESRAESSNTTPAMNGNTIQSP